MKRSKRKRTDLHQLEFDELVAETTDICLRLKSVRRGDCVFFPLPIRGRQTAEALMAERLASSFNDAWLACACERIQALDSVKDALILTSSYLSELLDLDIERGGSGSFWSGNYSGYVEQLVEGLSELECMHVCEILAFWKAIQGLLETYDECHALTDWGILECVNAKVEEALDTECCFQENDARLNEFFSCCVRFVHSWLKDHGAPSESKSAPHSNE